MLPADAPQRGMRSGPTTPAQKIAIAVLKRMAPHGESVHREDLVKGVAGKLTRASSDDKRDRRKEQAAKSIDQLIANGVLFAHGDDRVSSSPESVTVAPQEDFG